MLHLIVNNQPCNCNKLKGWL